MLMMDKIKTDGEVDKKKIFVLLDLYSSELDNIEEEFNIKGKSFIEICQRYSSNFYYFDSRKAELDALAKFFDSFLEKVRSKLTRQYTEKYPRQLSERQIEKYINSDENYYIWKEVQIAIDEVRSNYISVIESYTKLGYILNNIREMKKIDMEKYII